MKRRKARKSLMKPLQWHISPYSSLKLNIFSEFLTLVLFFFLFLLSLSKVSSLKDKESKL